MDLLDRRVVTALALAVPVAVCALLATVRDSVDGTDAALVLVLVVVAVASTGSRAAGVLAALSSTAWFDFFLAPPYYRFAIEGRRDIETAGLLVLVGLVVTEIALWGRRRQAEAERRDGYLSGVVSASGMVAAGSRPADVVAYTEKQVREVLGVSRCRYEPGRPGAHPRIERDGTLSRDGETVDVDRTGLPTHDVVELPVETAEGVVGRFVLTASAHVVRPSLEQRRVAVTLADVAGAALARSAATDA